jgi:LmbE family N-acetylglucosaminyl deacetylase
MHRLDSSGAVSLLSFASNFCRTSDLSGEGINNNDLKPLMIVGGHISDSENMAGAVMLKHKKAGWDVTMVHATAGEKGNPTLSAEDYLEMRLEDARASAEFIGASYEILPYKDGELEINEESIWILDASTN